MTTMAPQAVGESLDPRDPLLRLCNFFDDDTVELHAGEAVVVTGVNHGWRTHDVASRVLIVMLGTM